MGEPTFLAEETLPLAAATKLHVLALGNPEQYWKLLLHNMEMDAGHMVRVLIRAVVLFAQTPILHFVTGTKMG